MNNDDVRTYASFIGAILGIINFVWNIIRTIKIGFKYKIKSAKIKGEYEGKYILKIDLQISAAEKDLYIQKISVENTKNIFKDNSKTLEVNRIYDYFNDENLFSNSYKEIQKIIENKQFHTIQDFKLCKGEHRQLSIVECFNSYRNMDGYDPIPRQSYKINITVNNKTYTEDIIINQVKESDVGEFWG